jgi:hypothetical protein
LDQRKFNADGEQKKDDADLGKDLNGADVPDEIEAVRSDEGAGNQESGDGGKPELMEEEYDGDRDGENDEQIAQHAVISHCGHS